MSASPLSLARDDRPAGEPPGWFGKLPCLGDFASRRLPPAFVQPWDDWLARGLGAAQALMGAAWLEGYLVAPVLRFWLAPQALGTPEAWAGLLMPSVDRVGRHYPLTIAAVAAEAPGGPTRCLAAVAWYDALDEIARSMLESTASVQALEDALAALAPGMPADDATAEGETVWDATTAMPTLGAALGADGTTAWSPDAGTFATERRRWARAAVDGQPGSLWWLHGEQGPTQLRSYAGLPPVEAFVELLEGRS